MITHHWHSGRQDVEDERGQPHNHCDDPGPSLVTARALQAMASLTITSASQRHAFPGRWDHCQEWPWELGPRWTWRRE